MKENSSNFYFGKCWNPHVASTHRQIAIPVGKPCSYCDEAIVDGDQGLVMPHVDGAVIVQKPLHLDCFLRQIYGSVGHIEKRCSCYGGNEEDPPEMTKRQAAIAAVRLYEGRFFGDRK